MDIPEEAIKAADAAWFASMAESGGLDANASIAAARRAEYQVVAEWARKQTLEAVASYLEDEMHMDRLEIIRWLRALAEGDTDV